MASILTEVRSPEEEELLKKQAELEALRVTLADKELELTNLLAELRAFESQYLGTVGETILELEQVEQELLAAQRTKEAAPQVGPRPSAAPRQTSASASGFAPQDPQNTATDSSAATLVKELYRELVKGIHPDLASGIDDRLHRTELMKAANAAYQASNSGELERLLREWKSCPDSVLGEGPTADLVRTIRQIARVRLRISAIDAEVEVLNGSDLAVLKVRAEHARRAGRDLLLEMRHALTSEVGRKRLQLRSVDDEG